MATTTVHEVIHVGQTEVQFIATAEQTRGAISMFTAAVAPGAKAPPAHHHDVEEVVYGLEGTLTFHVNGVSHEIRPGDSLIVPGGAVHRFENLHEGIARILTVQTPGTIGPAFYREAGAVIGAGGPPDPVKMAQVMAQHGLTAVPPRA